MKTSQKIEFGDFQTPLALAQDVCALLIRKAVKVDAVVEPTCGAGSFLIAAARSFPKAKLLGWDINEDYVAEATRALKNEKAVSRSSLNVQDFFIHDWGVEFAKINGHLLVLGNLPWVTNSAVSALRGKNLPAKENFQGFSGMDALTGKSNFDISEWMLIQLIKVLRRRKATVAVLCKTATARKTLRFAWRNDGGIATAALYRFDAKEQFGVAVDACLFLLSTGETGANEADVFDDFDSSAPAKTLGLAGQDLVADIGAYRRLKHLAGLCPYQWRSGVKHDCSAVMELQPFKLGEWTNKLGEQISLEPDYLFPLLKCTDLAHGRATSERRLLLTQRRVGQDTGEIADKAPLTWRYLSSHLASFTARKSSIYNGKTPFAVFGVGEYTFSPWKVAISGMHKTPRFVLVSGSRRKPSLLDDTCYFLPFAAQNEAEVVCEILNSKMCYEFLDALIFPDSKRPITVDLLQRLNIHALAEECGLAKQWAASRHAPYEQNHSVETRQPELVMEK